MTDSTWPEFTYDHWKETYETLHMWMQVIGKVAVASAPPINHCWGSAFRLTSRGLVTGVLNHGTRSFAIALDFVDHHLTIETTDGQSRTIALTPRSVAEFYSLVMTTLAEMGLPIRIWSMPVEIPAPIRFEQDIAHKTYNASDAHTFWRILVEVERVFTAARCRFVGKVSPANFYWGSCDLALTRFSGRPAPPREGPAFMRDAYSHEVISHGFWPGNATLPEPVFYAYAVPEPAGLKDVTPSPAGAYYHRELGEFILPYEVVRQSATPDETLAAFIHSTYGHAATLGGWDRAALDRD
jgi:hypothetical protein